ncbi:MAG: DUF3103 family protein [Candidatus Marinimicrobia bacterium]|nr:DUF3103 family protein [Candidatus Neomarinimicrobiota bacterium]
MKKLSVFLTILVFLFLIISCETDNLPTNAITSSSEQFENDFEKIEISESDLALLNSYALEKSSDGEQRNAVVDEVLLKYFAMAVAKSLKHPEICQTLKKKIGEKFDGDYDALWDHIKNKRISGRDLRVLVNSRFSERTRNVLPIEKIEEVPLLQVALPVNFENWDGESTILVAYTPLTIDDMEWKEIYAYDADLKEYILDANTEPDFPVMVAGINERNKFVLNSYIAKTSDIMTEYRTEIMDKIKILDDHEPWTSGDPEIYIVSAGTREQQGMYNRVNLTHVNDENHWYYTDVNLFEWNTITWGNYTGYGVLEYDPNGYNYEVTVLEENLKVKIKEKSDGNDDYLGCVNSVGYDENSGTQYDFGDVKMVLKY